MKIYVVMLDGKPYNCFETKAQAHDFVTYVFKPRPNIEVRSFTDDYLKDHHEL